MYIDNCRPYCDWDFEVANKPTIVVSIYGNSVNSNRASLQGMNDLRQIPRELSDVYQREISTLHLG
jgi:hypothetical protein